MSLSGAQTGSLSENTGRSQKVLVRMIPGSEYSDFFENRPVTLREGYCRGWVSDHWLIKFGSQNVIEE